jgi:hypothetical protein
MKMRTADEDLRKSDAKIRIENRRFRHGRACPGHPSREAQSGFNL